MPLVSFLMSNYKTPPDQLRRALDSMLAQTLSDFEAVVLNDGVKDASYELLLEYAAKDDRIIVIDNERNLGLPASLNKGLGLCRGTYIARMDTDDICLPERLALQTRYMEEHPEVMFSGAWADVFDTDESAPVTHWQPVMCGREEYRIRLLFSGEPLLVHPTVIFRASFLLEHGLRYSEDPLYRYSEDYEMWTRCADCGAAGILENTVLLYRGAQNEARITVSRAKEMEQCVFHTQQKLFSRLETELTDETFNLNFRLLAGRKPYDLRYKRWMDLILRQNKKLRVYDQKTMKRLFGERWFNIVYYGMAEEKSQAGRLRRFFTLYPGGYPRMIKTILAGKNREKP